MNTLKFFYLTIFFMATLTTGCTSEQIYYGLQSHRAQECQSLTGSEREQCFKQIEDSYTEYENKRKQ